MEKINIVLADDHQIIIDGLKFMLLQEPKINIIYTAQNTNDTIQFINNNSTQVNLLITDINMPTISGIELCRKIKTEFSHIKVLMLSMYSSREIVKEAILAEADGYMLKNSGKDKLVEAIYKLTNDGTYYSEEIIPIIYSQFATEKKQLETIAHLTEREKEILILIAKENSSEQIAEKLFISIKTVGHHRQNILAKCDCKTSVGLVKYAIKTGLISL